MISLLPITNLGNLEMQLDHSSIFHVPFDGQFKHFKGTEENQGVAKVSSTVSRTGFVGITMYRYILLPARWSGFQMQNTVPCIFCTFDIYDICAPPHFADVVWTIISY